MGVGIGWIGEDRSLVALDRLVQLTLDAVYPAQPLMGLRRIRIEVDCHLKLCLCQPRVTPERVGPAQIDVRLSVERPRFDAEVNVMGLLNILDAARRWPSRRIVFISSGGVVYGDADSRPIPESAPKKPESPYGVSKLVSEYYLRCHRLLHGLDYVALRYSNVYGPRQDPHGEAGVVAIFSNRLIAGEPLTVIGNGEQTRDYVYVGDVVEANMIVSEAELDEGTGLDDRAFNVGTGQETSVNELASALMAAAGHEVPVERAPARPGELEWNSLVSDRLRALGWEAAVDLSDGLRRTYRWIAGMDK